MGHTCGVLDVLHHIKGRWKGLCLRERERDLEAEAVGVLGGGGGMCVCVCVSCLSGPWRQLSL